LLKDLKLELVDKEGIIAGEELKNHITVLEVFISSGVLDIEVKLELLNILINLSELDPSIKNSIKKIRTNPTEDIRIYLEDLSREILSEKNIEVFGFLEEKIRIIEKSNNVPIETLNYWDAIIKDLKLLYPNLPENSKVAILKRIEKVTNIYKKIIYNS